MRDLSLLTEVYEILIYLREMNEISWLSHFKKNYKICFCQYIYIYMRYLSVKRDIRDLFLLREMCEISCYLVEIHDISLFKKRYKRYLSIKRDMGDFSLLREVWEILLYLREMYETSVCKRDIWDIFLSREIYETSLCQERYTISFSIKGDVWYLVC